jgi:predicted nucleic acid-binding protein
MMTICLDTSAINNLMIDPEVERLTTTLLERFDVYITALNVAEIAKTTQPEKREQLRAFEKRLAKTYEPLDMPNEIVKKMTRAFGLRQTEVNFGITDDRRGLWVAISEPNSIGETERAELASWTERLEESNRQSVARVRARVDEIFSSSPNTRPKNAAEVLRFYLKAPWPLLYSLPSYVLKMETGRVLPLSQLDKLLDAKPSVWPLYLGAYAFLLYSGSFRQPEHGPPNNAGLLDAWSGVYLSFCDVFVTHDRGRKRRNGAWRTKGQYQALRVINTLNSREPRTQVFTWEQFRARLAG